MGFSQRAWSLPLQSLQSVWLSCSKSWLVQMADVGRRMHGVWALWMLSRKNNFLTPLELLEWPESSLILALLSKKEACSSPLEALKRVFDRETLPGKVALVQCTMHECELPGGVVSLRNNLTQRYTERQGRGSLVVLQMAQLISSRGSVDVSLDYWHSIGRVQVW
jgi:hypothetical protein